MKKQLLLFAFLFIGSLAARAQFTELDTPADSAVTNYEYVSAPTSQAVWGAGLDFSTGAQVASQVVVHSSDGGATWNKSVIPTPSEAWRFSSLEAFDANTAWATFFNGSAKGKLYRTTDGGLNWEDKTLTTMYANTASFANWSHIFDENEVITMGDPINAYFEIWKTLDGGTTWTRVPKANLPAIISGEFGLTDGYAALGDHIWFCTNKGRMVYSSDKGDNWLAAQTPYVTFFQPRMRDILHGCAWQTPTTGTGATLISLTDDGGVNWTSEIEAQLIVDDTTSFGYNIFDARYIPGSSKMVAVGRLADQAVNVYVTALSTDDGQTWSVLDADIYRYRVAMVNENLGYFGAQNTTDDLLATMWKYEGTLIPTHDVKQTSLTMNAFPNPTSDWVEITSNIGQSTDLWFSITNSSGQIVRRELWKNTNGSFQKTVKTSDLPNGIYTIELNNGNSQVFNKIVVFH